MEARRIVTHINFEDLSGIRASARQRKDTKSDAGQNLVGDVCALQGPGCWRGGGCGAAGRSTNVKGMCRRCEYKAHADAKLNVRDWYGLCCPLVLHARAGGRHPELGTRNGRAS